MHNFISYFTTLIKVVTFKTKRFNVKRSKESSLLTGQVYHAEGNQAK